jgi:endo-1,4-beta-mannosidase
MTSFGSTEVATRPLPERPWVGVNFWSRAGGPRMWGERYSPEVVREELDVLAANGCNLTRCFCYWPDFMPAPERLDPAVLDRFLDFLEAHHERGMGTIPTFIVGHMSGQNWDPHWRGDRDLYRDVWLVGQQAWFVAEVGRRFAAHPAVVGWLLSNEMPIYGGAAPTEEVTAWARLLMYALRSAGAHQPASVGDGAWGIEVSGRDNGFSLRRLAPLVDFLGPHVYPMSDDPVRHHSVAALTCVLAASFHRPVVLEEFGVSSDFASDENAAHYYRQVLHSTLLAGADGWIAWSNCDFDDLADEDPYRHHPFELHFGLTDRRGVPKPALGELARFSAMLAELPPAALAARSAFPQACIVVPEHFERVVPFTTEADRGDVRDTMLQAYVVGREADLRLGIARERDGLSPSTRLFLLPSAKILTAPGMASLRERAASGATVYLSYFPGSTATQRGPWLYGLEETFGVRHALRYGLAEPLDDTELTMTFLRSFGAIAEGEQLVFRIPPSVPALTFLPVEPLGAEVVATDGHGRPALLSHAVDTGTGVLCTYPLEYMAARTPWANPEPTWRLYDALASVAGVDRPLRCADPRVSCVVAGVGDGSLASVTNLSDQAVDADVLHDGAQPRRLSLGPYDVHTFLHPTYQ